MELLKHHENKDEKLKDLDYFTVDVHPQHHSSRCLFIVKKDGK